MTRRLARLLVASTATMLLAGCAAPAVTTPAPSPAEFSPVPATPPVPTPSPSPTVSAIEKPEPLTAAPGLRIKSVSNFRDVAGSGDGLPLADGGRMAVGVVYRSGKLAPISKADTSRLVKAGLTDIYDLRTPTVIARSPDPAIKGAKRHEVNVFAVKASDPVRPADVAEARDHMRNVNRNFVAIPAQREAIASVLESIADDRGPVLVHCTEGKDRTGWIAAMLQLTAGASQQTVIEEYLRSNEYRKTLIEREVAKAERSGGKQAGEIRRARLQVDASYIEAGLAEIRARYGDLEGYLTRGLGLSEQTVETLRARLRAD